MKKVLTIFLTLVVSLSLAACGITETPIPGVSDTSAPGYTPTATLPSASATTAAPTTAPTPTPTPFGEEPEHLGSGDILFDIYQHTALVDLNKDGTPEQLTFTAGGSSSTLQIGAQTYTIDLENQAQLFAVCDVDISDNILELAFTDEYNGDLADTEFPFTYLYWWNGTDLIKMGGLMDMKFDGSWRSDFHPADNFDAHGIVMCLTGTQNFSDVWYTGHYKPDGADRKLKEDLYAAPVLFHQEPLKLKTFIILLKNIDNTYFGSSYDVMWDYASGCGGLSWQARDYSNEFVAFLPQAGEQLTIVKVYGKKWFKLKASDGKQGWLKCEDMKVYGYWPVMGENYTADNLFDGIVIAG